MARIYWELSGGFPGVEQTNEARKEEVRKYFPGEIITGTHVVGRFLSKRTVTDKRGMFHWHIGYQEEDKIYEFFSGEYIGTLVGDPTSFYGCKLIREPFDYEIAHTYLTGQITKKYEWVNIRELTATELANKIKDYIDYKDQVADIMRNRLRMYDEELYSRIKKNFDENNEKNRLEQENKEWIENFINNR